MVVFGTFYWPPASLLCRDPRHVDVALHGRDRFDLAPGPATFAMPQACVRALAQPAVPSCLPDHSLVVVDIGHTAHCGHTGLQHLGDREELQASLRTHIFVRRRSGQGQHGSSTCMCLFEGSCTMAVPFTFLSSTPQVPAAGKKRVGRYPKQQDKVSHPTVGTSLCWEPSRTRAVALQGSLLAEDRMFRHHQPATGQSCPCLSGGLVLHYNTGSREDSNSLSLARQSSVPLPSSPSALSQNWLPTVGPLPRDTPAARMYCAPFPGWLSRLQISVPTGRAPSG